MRYIFDKSCHSVFALRYHLIVCVKYRRKAFIDDKIVNRLKEINLDMADRFGVDIINQECDTDHEHILFGATPKTDIIKFINSLKGVSARYLRKEFPRLKQILWKNSFWSDSYCLITTGQVTLNQLKKYVESQGK